MASGDIVSAGDPELEEDVAARRGPKLAVAAVGAVWVTMAALGVTVLRPELAEVKRVAERAAAAVAQPPDLVPFVGPAYFAGKRAGPPTAPSPAAPPASFTPARVPLPAGSPAPAPSPSPKPTSAEPTHSAGRTPVGLPVPAASGGPAYPGVPSAVSKCSQAANASSIGSIISAAQACASGLTSP
jgi:hypothetical protein